jgi:hypothetical protein
MRGERATIMTALATIALSLALASAQDGPAATDPPAPSSVDAGPVCPLLESRPDRAACGIGEAAQLIFACPDQPEGGVVTFHYTPEQLSRHVVQTRIVRCIDDQCRPATGEAHFADDPSLYFEIAPGLSVKKAVQVARLFQDGRLVRPGFSKRALQQLMEMRITRISPLSSGYELELVACGCESKIQVGIASEAGRDLLQIRNRTLEPPCS